MYHLLARYFDGVSRPQFERDLAEKTWVVRLYRDGQLVGFTSLLVRDAEFDDEKLTAIYSGDTIMSPEAWGTPALARAWIAAVNRVRSAQPDRRCYWLLLTSGYRTYRFLPVFWRNFYPRWDAQTPGDVTELMTHLAQQQYGDRYDGKSGLVRFDQPQRLRGGLAGMPEARLADPHIAFFAARNPRHRDGDELVCLTEISEANLTRAGRRMIAAGPP